MESEVHFNPALRIAGPLTASLNYRKKVMNNKIEIILLLVILILSKLNTFGQINDVNGIGYNDSYITINSITELQRIKLSYIVQDQQPILEYYCSDTICEKFDLTKYVKYTYFNRKRDLENVDSKASTYINSSLNNFKIVNDYLIVLSEDVRNKDILIWKKDNADKYKLISVYPNTIGVCLYCNPNFTYSNNDTIVIGGERIEEGSINGDYNYFTLTKDTLSLFRQEIVHGHAPWDEDSNPIKGAVCKRILTTHFYNYGQNEKANPIIYECADKNGNPIHGKITSETIDLYQMYWAGIGEIVETKKMKNNNVMVGEVIYYHGKSYIAVEVDNKWFWTLQEKIEIQ